MPKMIQCILMVFTHQKSCDIMEAHVYHPLIWHGNDLMTECGFDPINGVLFGTIAKSTIHERSAIRCVRSTHLLIMMATHE